MDKVISSFCQMKLALFREKMSTASVDLLRKLKQEFDNRYYNTGEETVDDLKYDVFIEVITDCP